MFKWHAHYGSDYRHRSSPIHSWDWLNLHLALVLFLAASAKRPKDKPHPPIPHQTWSHLWILTWTMMSWLQPLSSIEWIQPSPLGYVAGEKPNHGFRGRPTDLNPTEYSETITYSSNLSQIQRCSKENLFVFLEVGIYTFHVARGRPAKLAKLSQPIDFERTL